MEQENILEILKHIDPALLDYSEWLFVGMALKHEGYSVSVWDEWSRRDSRYHPFECERKWQGFHGSEQPVTVGTIIQYAKDQGWQPDVGSKGGYELDWDSVIGGSAKEGQIIDPAWLEAKELSEPTDWHPEQQLITYLETLFNENELVGYVTRSWERDGKAMPTKGCYDRTAGELIRHLASCEGDVGAVLGDYNPEVGAWIRFNPLDGKGVNNANVTDFRYALVESDDMEIEKQNAIIRELELPVAALVHSGGKSLHAIVRIEADSYEQYRKRVDYLYNICKKNGLTLDGQNRNPSRLSRIPGVMRKGRKQYLVDTNIGKSSWQEWQEWIESVNDDLPDVESLSGVWDALPELAPPLIEGVLRQGHKMLLAGPSKAGKSYALIELCIALAEGRKWLGWQCTKGNVLYVNLELDRASCLHRFRDVYEAMRLTPQNLGNIAIWNLRGKSMPMDSLAPKLIRRAIKKHYIAVIIDPIYKIITGDENSADQMAKFCNQFDKVCTDLGCAVIYCHHHSKGLQGAKRSMDRASGSGVFARDPDALLDLIELGVTEAIEKQEMNNAICRACVDFLNERRPDWEDETGQDTACSSVRMTELCEKLLTRADFKELTARIEEAERRTKRRTAWRIEGTLREYPRFDPVNLWFDFPIHFVDHGGLQDLKAGGIAETSKPGGKGARKRKPSKEEQLATAYEACTIDGEVTVKALAEYMDVTERAVRMRIQDSEGFRLKGKGIVEKLSKADKKEDT